MTSDRFEPLREVARTSHRDAMAFHDELAGGWDQRYSRRSFNDREQLVRSLLDRRGVRGQRWLDAGCGSGRLSQLLRDRGAQVVGLDGSFEMLTQARDRSAPSRHWEHGLLVHGDVIDLPFAPGSFDGVLCISVVEYTASPSLAVRELRRMLCDGGSLVFSHANRSSLVRKGLRVSHRLSGRPAWLAHSRSSSTPTQIYSVAESAGLSVDEVVLFGGPLSRWARRSPWLSTLILVSARAVARPHRRE